MLSRALNYLYGYERLRHRGDRFFLAGEFERARHEYTRARSVLGSRDYRSDTIEALIRQCDAQGRMQASPVEPVGVGDAASSRTLESAASDDAAPFHPGLGDLFELAIAEKEPERIEAYRQLSNGFKAGYVALVQGNAGRAVRAIGEAAASTAPSFIVHLEHGRALSLAGEMAEARAALKRAERSAPDDAEVAVLLSAVNIELGRNEDAFQRLTSMPQEIDNPDVSFLIGRSLAGLKRDDAALEKFRETVAMEPNFHEAYFEAALVLRNTHDHDARFQLLNRACGLAPDEVRYNRELAQLVVAEAFDEEAGLAACDRLMVTDEDNAWEYLHWIAQLYIRRGWKREARDPLEKALQLVPPERNTERREIESRLSTLS